MLLTFIFSLFCGTFNCPVLRTEPSDPLNIIRSNRIGHLWKTPLVSNPLVYTNIGAVEGYIIKTISRREIYAFEGIPFGEYTGGKNRFKPPVPKAPWFGIRLAKKPGSFCSQIHPIIPPFLVGSEDCLFLNIFTPKLPEVGSHPKLPVIIWIHGGSYGLGAGSEYGPSYLLDTNDVIYVSINYRLGVLGFLCTGDENSPGNYGLKDQALAIKWVYENIAHFGGDQTKITLLGQSAGAASVHLHMISNQSRNYFSGAVSLSGTAFNIWSMYPPLVYKLMNAKLARSTNCPIDNNKAFVDCLRRYDAIQLTRHLTLLGDWFLVPGILFPPVVEIPGPEAFLTESPIEAYINGNVAKIPWITTRTQDDGLLGILVVKFAGLFRTVAYDWKGKAPLILSYYLTARNSPEITEKVTKYYMGDMKPLDTPLEVYTDMWTDRYYSYSLHQALIAHSKIAPTYSYIFDVRGRHNFPSLFNMDVKEWGVSHGDDLWYILNSTIYGEGWKTDEPGYSLVPFMNNLLSNFADKREPLHTDENGNDIKIWDPITDPNNLRYLRISTNIEMISEPVEDRLRFWESLDLSDMPLLDIYRYQNASNYSDYWRCC